MNNFNKHTILSLFSFFYLPTTAWITKVIDILIGSINSDKNDSSTLNIQKSQNPVLSLRRFSILAYISYS